MIPIHDHNRDRMSRSLIFIFSLLLLNACRPSANVKDVAKDTSGSVEGKSDTTVTEPDSTGISNSLTGFFSWYDAHVDSLSAIRFVNDAGEHLTLDENKLQTYLSALKGSGYVSDELLADEVRFYRACAKEWKTESKDEIPSGLSADRFYCAQDYIAPYQEGKVSSVVNGDRAKAVLTLTGEMGERSEFRFELKKEAGKWLLSRLDCSLGVDY